MTADAQLSRTRGTWSAAKKKELWRELEGWLWASPRIIGMLLFTIIPMSMSFYWSFTFYDIVNPAKWVGLVNYKDMFTDVMVVKTLLNTLYYAGISVPLGLFLGLLLALVVNQNVKGISFWRTIYYLPAITAGAAYARLWRFLLMKDFGLVNTVLGMISIQGPNWFSPRWIIPAFILTSIWTVGGSMIINLAGLQSIPTELYDAAKVDGARGWRLLRHITLPMMSPVIFFNLVMGLIGAMQSFSTFYIMLGGGNALTGPSDIGMVYMLYLYRAAFLMYQMGYGCALAWLLFVIILVLTLLVFRSSSVWVYYQGESRS